MLKCGLIGLIFLWLMPCVSQAQRTWWVGGGVEIAETSGLIGWAYGVGGGVVADRYSAGGFVMQTTPLLEGETDGIGYSVSLQYGGLSAGYHRTAIGRLEVVAGFRLALGRAQRLWERGVLPTDRDAIYLAVPFLGLEAPIGSSVRLSLSSGFRFFGGFDQIDQWRNRDLYALANTLAVRVHFGKW